MSNYSRNSLRSLDLIFSYFDDIQIFHTRLRHHETGNFTLFPKIKKSNKGAIRKTLVEVSCGISKDDYEMSYTPSYCLKKVSEQCRILTAFKLKYSDLLGENEILYFRIFSNNITRASKIIDCIDARRILRYATRAKLEWCFKKYVYVAVLCSFKMPLRLQEAVDIIAIYFECLENATIAARLYALRYPQRRRYGSRMFSRLANRFRTTGSVIRPLYLRQRTRRTEENVINVLAYVEFNPQLSVLLGPLV
ncbi:hypothetical protein FQR65_LT09061 [Abscondita terminalis]|nr:hypothetical protein FQR65_LT09061 [Abscondita terminalis]